MFVLLHLHMLGPLRDVCFIALALVGSLERCLFNLISSCRVSSEINVCFISLTLARSLERFCFLALTLVRSLERCLFHCITSCRLPGEMFVLLH